MLPEASASTVARNLTVANGGEHGHRVGAGVG
jgi:hypothetical protein